LSWICHCVWNDWKVRLARSQRSSNSKDPMIEPENCSVDQPRWWTWNRVKHIFLPWLSLDRANHLRLGQCLQLLASNQVLNAGLWLSVFERKLSFPPTSSNRSVRFSSMSRRQALAAPENYWTFAIPIGRLGTVAERVWTKWYINGGMKHWRRELQNSFAASFGFDSVRPRTYKIGMYREMGEW